ncbi:MAG: helix-turn-helix domain-containing protein [Bdellovibrio sp.]|nr:helix-turn-helix domain-containing protein [Bdellovibrio sp.]
MNKCGDFLRNCREAQGLSQRDVANELGYNTAQFISNWERGVSQPPIPTLKKLAKIYKIDADVLFNVILEAQIEIVRQTLRERFVEENKAASSAEREATKASSKSRN